MKYYYTFTFLAGRSTTWANSRGRVAGYVTAHHTRADRDQYVDEHDRVPDRYGRSRRIDAATVRTLRAYGVTDAQLMAARAECDQRLFDHISNILEVGALHVPDDSVGPVDRPRFSFDLARGDKHAALLVTYNGRTLWTYDGPWRDNARTTIREFQLGHGVSVEHQWLEGYDYLTVVGE